MKKIILIALSIFLLISYTHSQTKSKGRPPTQSDIDKMMNDATQGMSGEDRAAMKEMMKVVMPDMAKKPASVVVTFTDNKKLIPTKDVTHINSIPRKTFTDADVKTNTNLLYGKLMTKIPTSEKAIITNVLTKAKTGSALMEAATISFMQGHNLAAIGLALKAVQAEPKNVNHQNNLAAILSQSGYPEKAIPYLRKLSTQYPANSTVLHNLGYAWLSLGQTDTAKVYFASAVVHNSSNPETQICQGFMDELKGDPKKAADNYVESFTEDPNPFTENLVKNVDAADRLGQIDFDQIKSTLTIYEYFKIGWIRIPALSDNVEAYEKNMAIKNGYSKMFDKLNTKIETMSEASNIEVQELADKGEAEFVKGMMQESLKGISMMSMPAVYVQNILQTYLKKWTERYIKESTALREKMNTREIEMTKVGENDKCPDFNRKNDEFLAYANPIIRKFYAKKIEEYRVWLNAFCTWSWYIAGNPKNVVIAQSIAWTSYLTGIYQQAIENQYAIAKSCVKQNGDIALKIPVPAIPNFTCPTVVSVPFGLDEQFLDPQTVNFDNNDWDIKQADGATTPNVTLSPGIDENYITEPGKYGNPYVKTGNGSMNVSGINYADSNDPELAPFSKILEDLAQTSKTPADEQNAGNQASSDHGKKLTVSDYKKIRNAELTRKLLKEMMKTKCPGDSSLEKERKQKFVVTLGELELDPLPVDENGEPLKWDEKNKVWVDSKGDWILPPTDLGVVETGKEGFKDKMVTDVRDALETSGMQTTIINGMEGIKNMENSNRGLFDQ